MTAAPEMLGLIEWHCRQAAISACERGLDRRSGDEADDPGHGADVTAVRV
jgi:hypothetical protein